MKLIISKFEELAKRKNYGNGKLLWKKMGGGKSSYSLVKKGNRIGYSMVKSFYNEFGIKETLKIIDFEGVTINEFRKKFVIIGNKLY